MHKWGDLQVVDINEDIVLCRHCGSNIVDIANYMYDGDKILYASYWEELCVCKECGNNFILQFHIFDKAGHIYSSIFSEDINNPEYQWQEELTDEQKEVIADHIKDCEECRDRLSQEILTDAWLKDFIEALKSKQKQ